MNEYPIKECPKCGHNTAYIKQKIKGTCQFKFNMNGDDEADNSELHGNLSYKTISKYAYCVNCDKRLFAYSEDFK